MKKLLGAAALDLELVSSRDVLRLAPLCVVVVADDFKADDAASSNDDDDGKRTTTTMTTANAFSSSSKLEKLFLRAADGVQYALLERSKTTRQHHQSMTTTENYVGVVCSSSDGEVVYAWLTASRFVLMLAMTRETEEEEEEEEAEEEFVRVRKKFQAMESALTRARMNPFFEEEEEKDDDDDDDDERKKEAGGKKWESFRQALANAAEV